MKLSETALSCSLSFLAAFLSQPSDATRTFGYLKLERDQAWRYIQCQPQNYDYWYKVEKGQNLSDVLSEIFSSLPVPVTTPTATTALPGSSTSGWDHSGMATEEITPGSTVGTTQASGDGSSDTSGSGFINSVSDDFPFSSVELLQPIPTGIPSPAGDRAKRQAEEADNPGRIERLKEINKWPPPPGHPPGKRKY